MSDNNMQTLRTLADTAERESSRILAERRQVMDQEQQRLTQLQAYLQEYAAPESGSGLLVDSIRTRRDFVSRIRQGIEQQEKVLAGLSQQLDLDLQRWRDARTHALALQRYSDRLQMRVEEKVARREQGRQDEVGRQQHLLRSV